MLNELIFIAVILPFFSVLLLALSPLLARQAFRLALLIALLEVTLWLALLPSHLAGAKPSFFLAWLPSLDLNLSFTVDGLGYLYALMVTFIGLLVILFSRDYVPHDFEHEGPGRPLGLYYSYLLLFMGSMLGVVLSANLALLFLFWELTSITSFLLIGFNTTSEKATFGATKALIITGLGGVLMLVGFLILKGIAGSAEISRLSQVAATIKVSPLYPLAFFLVLIGAATKSAQFPFHIWLPDAMEATTPISAYLHSATMVAAGVFLLARIYPVLGGTDLWIAWVSALGLVTMLAGAFSALFQTKVKAILAFSTISQYGYITLLYGLGTGLGVLAGTNYVLQHAIIKASLFFLAGLLAFTTGKKDIREMGGLYRDLPLPALMMAVALLALAGIPFFNGFWSKELFFKALWERPYLLIPAGLASLFTFLYSLRLWLVIFTGKKPAGLHLHPPTITLLVATGVLVFLSGFVFAFFPNLALDYLVEPATQGLTPVESVHLALHLDKVFLTSLFIYLAGLAILPHYRQRALRWGQALAKVPTDFSLFEGYKKVLQAGDYLSRLALKLQSGHLEFYLAVLAAGLSLLYFWQRGTFLPPLAELLRPLPLAVAINAVLLAAGALLVASLRSYFYMIIAAGVTGYASTTLFALLYAPGVALVSVLVETITGIVLLYILSHTPTGRRPQTAQVPARPFSWGKVFLAASTGVVVFLMFISATPLLPFPGVVEYYFKHSLPMAHQSNIVSAILVDFRGLDTVGETTVFLIAGLAVFYYLMKGGSKPGHDVE